MFDPVNYMSLEDERSTYSEAKITALVLTAQGIQEMLQLSIGANMSEERWGGGDFEGEILFIQPTLNHPSILEEGFCVPYAISPPL